MNRTFRLLVVASTWITAAASSHAHFPWVTVDDQGKAALFFGETPADRTYKLPPTIAPGPS